MKLIAHFAFQKVLTTDNRKQKFSLCNIEYKRIYVQLYKN